MRIFRKTTLTVLSAVWVPAIVGMLACGSDNGPGRAQSSETVTEETVGSPLNPIATF